ncbi:MAG: mandelate racemase/muconate lactonizing enzyme family protein, partial [Candidatus Hydrogenedentes bacterium]|nr:mandelate racemase/muconate lactonizing enzyme family protein [Candidatus Hydrogenedentota bacterium]
MVSGRKTDIRVVETKLFFLPVETRVPLKFGPETLTSVTCARVRVTVETTDGRQADGWGETPLSVQWVWPSSLGYETRHKALKEFCCRLAGLWPTFGKTGHPVELGHDFMETVLPSTLDEFNASRDGDEPMPWLAALVCCSAFDIAVHDAYGKANNRPIYEMYTREFMNRDLACFLEPASDSGHAVSFDDKYPADYLVSPRPDRLPAWHLVGGKDLLDADELDGSEPDDGYPVTLREWIERDGLKCLKVKLRGTDSDWDYDRLVKVGEIAIDLGVEHLTTDFNCTVTDPAYVNDILDRIAADYPAVYAMILYVEQPFPYDLERYKIDVHSVSARKPLFMDESAHAWR